MISIEHVSKSYAKSSVKAVDDINLHVKSAARYLALSALTAQAKRRPSKC